MLFEKDMLAEIFCGYMEGIIPDGVLIENNPGEI
jgi:hypothetical protein